MSELKNANKSLLPDTAVAVLMLLFVAIMLWPLALDLDVSHYAGVGMLVAQGQPLYTEFLEVNPPMPVLIAQLSFWIAGVINSPFDKTHQYVVLLVQFSVYILTLLVLAPALQRAGMSRLFLVYGIGVAALMITPDVGRRDWLGSLALIPLGISLSMRWSGFRTPSALVVVVGVLAGISAMWKPHFALLVVLIFILDLSVSRKRGIGISMQSWIALATLCGSWAAFLLVYPVYATEIVPFASQTFGRLQPGMKTAFLSLGEKWLVGAVLFLIVVSVGAKVAEPKNIWAVPAVGLALVFFVGGSIIVVVQAFGHAYHHLPIKIAAFIAMFLSLTWISSRWPGVLSIVLCVSISLALTGYVARYYFHVVERSILVENPLTEAMQPVTPGDHVVMFSPMVRNVSHVVPFLDARWGSISTLHWPMVALMKQDGRHPLNNPPPEEVRAELETWYLQRIGQRVSETQPVRVAIDVSSRMILFENQGFDILRWLRSNDKFNEFWLSSEMEPLGEPIAFSDPRLVFQIYVSSDERRKMRENVRY